MFKREMYKANYKMSNETHGRSFNLQSEAFERKPGSLLAPLFGHGGDLVLELADWWLRRKERVSQESSVGEHYGSGSGDCGRRHSSGRKEEVIVVLVWWKLRFLAAVERRY